MEELIVQYENLLNKWNEHINLVQSKSLKQVRTRHIADCLQLVPYLSHDGTIFDIGSGAGLPGIVLAIAGFNNLVLIEKNNKKAVFLKEVRRVLNLKYEVYNDDVYKLNTEKYEKPFFAVSRAFGSLSKLIDIMLRLSIKEGLFHRGKSCRLELHQLPSNVKYEIIKSSLTDDGVLLRIQSYCF